jgi:outer membrane protein assembly factor BamB
MKHIRILVLILCACLVSVAWGQQQEACKAYTPWQEFHRYNMERWNPCEHVLNVHNVGGLQLKWSYNAGAVYSSPAVANRVVYVGSMDGDVYALDASTGALLWTYSTGSQSEVTSSPAVANGVVYVGSGTYSYPSYVFALNASTGALLWSYLTGNWVFSSPAVVNGVVYVGSYDGNVYALNATTGSLVWSYTTGSDVEDSPAVADGVLYVGSDDHNVYALNAKTGV